MRDRLLYSIIAIAIAALLVVLYFYDPSTEKFFPPCPTNYLTSYYCPGCGTLRALHALVHGDLKDALSQNILSIIFIPILLAMYFFPILTKLPLVPTAILLVIIIFAVLRNIPYFSFLAPH